jgi:hypothetical protein
MEPNELKVIGSLTFGWPIRNIFILVIRHISFKILNTSKTRVDYETGKKYAADVALAYYSSVCQKTYGYMRHFEIKQRTYFLKEARILKTLNSSFVQYVPTVHSMYVRRKDVLWSYRSKFNWYKNEQEGPS